MLLTHEVETSITARNVNHYKDKGYIIPMKHSDKTGRDVVDSATQIWVRVEDLPMMSHAEVQYKCDVCGEAFTTTWCIWNRRKYRELGDMCKDCAMKIKLPYAMKDKYGYENCANIPEFIDKKKKTNVGKYGNEWAIASNKVRDVIHNTILSKYGVDNPMQNEQVKQKAKNTNNQRYGGNSPICSAEIREKAAETCLSKYGVANAFQAKEAQMKARKTLYKNGTTPSSKAERAMCELLKVMFGEDNCFSNYPEGVLSLDCLVLVDGIKIDFEYDGYYWHKDRVQHDSARNAVLMNNGYRIVRIRADNQDTMPTQAQIQEAVDYLVKDNHHIVFIDMNK